MWSLQHDSTGCVGEDSLQLSSLGTCFEINNKEEHLSTKLEETLLKSILTPTTPFLGRKSARDEVT